MGDYNAVVVQVWEINSGKFTLRQGMGFGTSQSEEEHIFRKFENTETLTEGEFLLHVTYEGRPVHIYHVVVEPIPVPRFGVRSAC